MQGRTFFRIMIDNLFINNPVVKAISMVVNFCNEQQFYNKNSLKFSEKMPFKRKEETYKYKTRFIFDSSKISGASYK